MDLFPKQLVEQNSAYEIYFEAENLVGLKTIVKDNGENFLFTTNYEAEYAAETSLTIFYAFRKYLSGSR